MGKPDFKNAAAKLLEKHSSQVQHPTPQAPELPPQPEVAAAKPMERPVLSPTILVDEGEPAPAPPPRDRQAGLKASIIIGLMIVATAVMVLVVPETIVGIGGNIAVGMLAGAAFGYIIVREI